ncbi:type III polyketide synthase [Novosphingopyxis sp.]|uniref:type III polyketide synthase n=1 Tax=Novosphingopyxis sp. TaxID=2709690 RepID=UPI003B5CE89E
MRTSARTPPAEQELLAYLHAIGTAVPETILKQSDVMAILEAGRGSPMPERMEAILFNTGIAQRHIARPVDFYMGPRSWPERAHVYEEVGSDLFKRAAEEALAAAGLAPADIDTILFVSTTGTMTPSLPSRMIAEMGFWPGTRTVPLFGHGCAGGVTGLSIAADLTPPGKRTLFVAMELCSLAYDHQRMDKKDVIAAALFADGCAAAVLSGDGPGAALGDFVQRVWPDTIDMMGWEIGDTGFDLVLAKDIPAFVAREFAPMCDAFLAEQGLALTDLGEPACHPGGGRVVDALAEYFMPGLQSVSAALPATRVVLQDYGNMSSPTILFVLRRLLDDKPTKPFLVTALGPGFTGAIGVVRP